MNYSIVNLVQSLCTCCRPRSHQIACQFSLAIHHYSFGIGVFSEVNAADVVAKCKLHTFMYNTFEIHAFTDAGFPQQTHCPFLEYSSPDAAQYIFARAAFNDDVGNACIMQELAE